MAVKCWVKNPFAKKTFNYWGWDTAIQAFNALQGIYKPSYCEQTSHCVQENKLSSLQQNEWSKETSLKQKT